MADVTSTHDSEVGFFHAPQAPDLFCEATQVGSIDTPNEVRPDVAFEAHFISDKIELDGEDVSTGRSRRTTGTTCSPPRCGASGPARCSTTPSSPRSTSTRCTTTGWSPARTTTAWAT